ncbi:MAG TPA: prolipoprotein diacylglyceryl transferase family protein, partial [Chryseosolibacter sp.]|nr:prolipoprotein diacylglyceryl transferase family protein [Chryseosolibacter sp.]
FSSGGFTLRSSAVLFVLGFLVCRQLLFHLFKEEGKPLKEVSALYLYMVLVALIGARLGHLLFHEPASLLSKVLTIIFPFELKPEFHLLGSTEFSAEGATLALMLFLWLYRRRRASFQSYFFIADRVGVVACLAGFFLLISSFLNSEPKGKVTQSALGTVFVSPIQKGLMKVPCCIMRSPDGANPLENVAVRKDPVRHKLPEGQQSVILYLFFTPGISEQIVNEFLLGDVKSFLFDMSAFVHEPGDEPLHFRIFLERNGNYIARIQTEAIARFPIQVFEATACFILFVFLWFNRKKFARHPGRLFSFFMIFFWTCHFALGFLRDTQALVDMVLSIVFVQIGVVVVLLSARKSREQKRGSSSVTEDLFLKKD